MAGGPKVRMSGGQNLARELRKIATQMTGSVRVGFLEKSTYPTMRTSGKSAKAKRKAARKQQVALYVATVAMWQNQGTTRTKARPFFTNTIREKSPGWGADVAKIAPAVNYDGKQVLSLMGTRIKDQIVESIVRWPADNAPSTVKQKGFNKGLIRDGIMQRAVEFEVDK